MRLGFSFRKMFLWAVRQLNSQPKMSLAGQTGLPGNRQGTHSLLLEERRLPQVHHQRTLDLLQCSVMSLEPQAPEETIRQPFNTLKQGQETTLDM
jgi:hypothetical protein